MAQRHSRPCRSRGKVIQVKARLPVIAIAAVFALLVPSAPALAAPELSIAMAHANAYGLQAGECPTGKEESFPDEPERNCGVDPFTGSGTTFTRESGFDTYTITVRNTASNTSGPAAGDTLTCEPGSWAEGPTITYGWLRNGAVIAGAESDEYTLVAADEGKAVQCLVAATNASGVAVAVTNAIAVSLPQSTELPALETGSRIHVPGESSTFPVGAKLECEHEAWANSPTFSYHWLRNGTPIPGAESSTYTLAAADIGTSVQCEVTATNAGGSVVAQNEFFTYVGANAPSPEPPYHEVSPAIPVPGSSNETTGPVTVADTLPAGLSLTSNAGNASWGSGWEGHGGEGSCSLGRAGASVTCTTSRQLVPGTAYAPITLHVRVDNSAPLGYPPSGGVENTAAASGGGAETTFTRDGTAIASAVPFGIAAFRTSVVDALGNPFTQSVGHPFAANASFILNSTVENSGALWPAGGTPKDIETDLPPGFLGNPQNAPKCTLVQVQERPGPSIPTECPADSAVGFVRVALGGEISHGVPRANNAVSNHDTYLVYNVEAAPGLPASLAFVDGGAFFALNAKLRSDGNYGVTIGDTASGRVPGNKGVLGVNLTLCGYGITGFANEAAHLDDPATVACAAPSGDAKPFLSNPSRCTGPAPSTTLRADTYQEPSNYVSKSVYNGASLAEGAPNATESFVTGCSGLQFQPEVEFNPDSASEGGTSQADEPTGASFALKVPQTNEAGVNATPELKNATVTLPQGVTVDPSAADGLQACGNAQFGLGSTVEPVEPAACPLASQIGTVKVVTPLLEKPLEGQVFLGEPECSPCSTGDAEDGRVFRLFLQVRSVERGVIVKLAGHVTANPTTGRLQATFTEQPQLPFSELLLTFNGGARASLANPQTCGAFTTTTDLTPWSAPGLGGLSGTQPTAGTPDATPSSSFNVDWNGAGGACPASLPFSPSFSAGSQTPTAGASSPFAVTIGREDREQDLSGITVSTPPGLLGKIAGIPQCPEAQANAGTCGPESQIGTATVGAGPGPHPFYLGGRIYLTGPYKGDPFGLSIVTPAVAGPFNLGTVVVRAAIAVNRSTAALTIASDPLPQYVDGVQLRLRTIHVEVNRPGFMLNPTSCAQQGVDATIAAQGAGVSVSSPFAVGGCQDLPFGPSFSASTQGSTSKAHGASLAIAVKSAPGQANIGKVDVQLPKALPARLIPTLQNACTEAQFAANPAGCPVDSFVGTATAVTPILNAPLSGPAILVSHGGAAFPDLEFLLQGENGVEIVLDGKTDIKQGITYSKFESVPDAPISSFATTLPEGPHSILAAPSGDLCGRALVMPTTITAQNGKQIIEKTKLTVTGCGAVKIKPLTRAQKLKRGLLVCRTKFRTKAKKAKRAACETLARQRYGPIKQAKKTNRRGK
jgi:hypothetical protein